MQYADPPCHEHPKSKQTPGTIGPAPYEVHCPPVQPQPPAHPKPVNTWPPAAVMHRPRLADSQEYNRVEGTGAYQLHPPLNLRNISRYNVYTGPTTPETGTAVGGAVCHGGEPAPQAPIP